ncbi:MAG: CbiX/SirB N-terminal domain-containing protein [Thermoplasmata archaeon]|nr:CbiX/SirB N-terminal domain-containing protein [Thermoplasmata archaeon]
MRTGIMIGGHGSTMSFNKGVLDMQADRLRAKGYDNVYVGFNETSFPSIREAAEEMVADGYDDIVILPFFVASGLHIVRDIPMKHFGFPRDATEGTAEISGKQVRVRIEQPFGEEPLLADILAERVEELRTPGRDTRVIVMGHGSRLPYNKEVVLLNAKRLEERGYGKVYYGFNEFDEPKIEDTIVRMMDEGAEEVIALPLFISLGKHLTMDVPGKLGIENFSDGGIVRRDGRDVEVKYAVPIGADPRLCDVLVEKLRRLGLR